MKLSNFATIVFMFSFIICILCRVETLNVVIIIKKPKQCQTDIHDLLKEHQNIHYVSWIRRVEIL